MKIKSYRWKFDLQSVLVCKADVKYYIHELVSPTYLINSFIYKTSTLTISYESLSHGQFKSFKLNIAFVTKLMVKFFRFIS